MPHEQAPSLAEAHLVVCPTISAMCRILSMAHSASVAELETFLGRLDPD